MPFSLYFNQVETECGEIVLDERYSQTNLHQFIAAVDLAGGSILIIERRVQTAQCKACAG